MSGQSLLVPGELSPTRSVPGNIRRPEYVGKPAPTPYTGPEVQTPETVEAMRTAGRIAARAMAEAARHIAPGVTTDELDRVAHEFLCDHGAYPSTLDRKSTRLNSSHVKISYAVFCLKKKK